MIELKQVDITAGQFSLKQVSFQVPGGGYAALMGKTGSGKTTIIEAICGLRRISRGTIILGDRDVTDLPPADRGVGYVPQDGALFLNMTVAQHLAFALKIRKVPREDIDARVGELGELLGIAHLLERRPRGLSGGERQRVSLGRALSFRPEVLLLDEPISALDDQTREQMFDLLARVRRHEGATVLHITHSREEAERLADFVIRIDDGAVRRVDAPQPLRETNDEDQSELPRPAPRGVGDRK